MPSLLAHSGVGGVPQLGAVPPLSGRGTSVPSTARQYSAAPILQPPPRMFSNGNQFITPYKSPPSGATVVTQSLCQRQSSVGPTPNTTFVRREKPPLLECTKAAMQQGNTAEHTGAKPQNGVMRMHSVGCFGATPQFRLGDWSGAKPPQLLGGGLTGGTQPLLSGRRYSLGGASSAERLGRRPSVGSGISDIRQQPEQTNNGTLHQPATGSGFLCPPDIHAPGRIRALRTFIEATEADLRPLGDFCESLYMQFRMKLDGIAELEQSACRDGVFELNSKQMEKLALQQDETQLKEECAEHERMKAFEEQEFQKYLDEMRATAESLVRSLRLEELETRVKRVKKQALAELQMLQRKIAEIEGKMSVEGLQREVERLRLRNDEIKQKEETTKKQVEELKLASYDLRDGVAKLKDKKVFEGLRKKGCEEEKFLAYKNMRESRRNLDGLKRTSRGLDVQYIESKVLLDREVEGLELSGQRHIRHVPAGLSRITASSLREKYLQAIEEKSEKLKELKNESAEEKVELGDRVKREVKRLSHAGLQDDAWKPMSKEKRENTLVGLKNVLEKECREKESRMKMAKSQAIGLIKGRSPTGKNGSTDCSALLEQLSPGLREELGRDFDRPPSNVVSTMRQLINQKQNPQQNDRNTMPARVMRTFGKFSEPPVNKRRVSSPVLSIERPESSIKSASEVSDEDSSAHSESAALTGTAVSRATSVRYLTPGRGREG